MTLIKKIIPYLFISVLVIGLWQLFTSTDNYAWSPKKKEQLLLEIALGTIFTYKSGFWLAISNLSVFIIKCIIKNRNKTASIAFFAGAVFYFFAGQLVDKRCAASYYMVFVNQSVAEEYLQDPIKEAGYYIGPILTEKIKDKKMELRRYAISGLGVINYKPATETFQQILCDKTEPDYIRADAYAALAKFNSVASKKVLSDVESSAIDPVDKNVVELGNYFLQSN